MTDIVFLLILKLKPWSRRSREESASTQRLGKWEGGIEERGWLTDTGTQLHRKFNHPIVQQVTMAENLFQNCRKILGFSQHKEITRVWSERHDNCPDMITIHCTYVLKYHIVLYEYVSLLCQICVCISWICSRKFSKLPKLPNEDFELLHL